MKLTRPSDVRALLAELNFEPSKILGQNFLIDANILHILVESADVQPGDTVIEIGPGLGVLTAPLLERAGRIIAIEKDRRLHAHLAESLQHPGKLNLILADALDVDLASFAADKLVSNLPYSVGSRILMDVFAAPKGPARIVVTVQKEVGDRLGAAPWTADYGLLSVCAQLKYDVRKAKVISPTCFYPPPQVKSAIVVLDRKSEQPDGALAMRAMKLAKTAFSNRRKQMGTIYPSLTPGLIPGLDPRLRPENLAPANWLALARSLTMA